MDANASEDEINVDWTTDDELEIISETVLQPSLTNCNGTIAKILSVTEEVSEPSVRDCHEISAVNGEVNLQNALDISWVSPKASSSGLPSRMKLIDHFVGMGFARKLVTRAIEENGEKDTDSILNSILTYSTLEDPSVIVKQEQQLSANSDRSSSDYNETCLDDFSDMESWSQDEIEENTLPMSEEHKKLLALANTGSLSEKEQKMLFLANMGYTLEEASIAMDRCGSDASVDELTDFICAAQMAREESCYLPNDNLKPRHLLYNGNSSKKKRKFIEMCKKKNVPEDTIRLPNPMIGFGVPSQPTEHIERPLPESAIGRPYFYYENVALAPKGVWDTISRFLYDIEPEFVDSKFFCATARKRGYVHNLPIENRFPLVPLPPLTIQSAFPLSRKWWPSWDSRDKLNCIQTAIASAKLTERIRTALERYDGEPPETVQKYVLEQCRKWNLVWVGRNKLAPLEPDEVEMLLGFPKNHTRGGGISRTDRYKSLGNSFQVDTVAYHLSVLRDMFPNGINILSLFSGIGGAEVALHRLGVKLNNVVAIEKSKVNRDIVKSWWEQTNQTGTLFDFDDVQLFDGERAEHIMNTIGGFDLIIGGSPCNNLAGSNRVSRDGLEGSESRLFYDYFRILDLVKCIMRDKQL